MSARHQSSLAPPSGAELLLERADRLSALGEMLAGVSATGQGRLVLVGGEAGVGKTTLLRRFSADQAEFARTLWGACEPLRTPRPLGPLADIAEAAGGRLQELVVEGARAYDVAVALLAELRGRSPAVVVIEDLHWADEATLDVVIALAPRIASAPALVLATYRDDELGRSPQLRFVLGEMTRQSDRLRVLPLSEAAVAELAEPRGIDGRELHRRTGGNPFFVTEAIAAGVKRMPETVRDAVLARAARLTAPARVLLDAAAVVPGQIELWLLEALAGELDGRLDECLASGELTAGRAHVAFRHELARLAIEEAIAPNRRLALNGAAIAALAERGGDDPDFARLAHHAEAAGDGEGVLRWAPRAAARAADAGAHREAAAQYARALRFAGTLPPERQADLLLGRVEECRLSAQFEEAIEAQERALELQRTLDDRRGEGDSLRSLSRLFFFGGRGPEGEPLALRAVEVLEPLGPSHELAMAYGNLSQRGTAVLDWAAAVEWGTRALELAGRLGDDEASVYALVNIGAAQLDAGQPEGRSTLERGLELARRHRLDDYVGRAGMLLAMAGVTGRDFALADAYLDDTLAFCGEWGLDTWRGYLLALRARLELGRGHWHDAAESASAVLRDPRSPPVARGWALPTLGLIRARRGDGESAELLDEAWAGVHASGEPILICPVIAARAEAAWLSGEATAVERLTDETLALALDLNAPWLVGELAYWRWQAGVRDQLPGAAIAEPYGLAIGGDWCEAAACWDARGCPYEAALARVESPEGAVVRQAIERLQGLGARPAAAIAARRQRERGVRGLPRGPRPRTRQNPAGLTARELEVLVLLAEGLRNAQIAERLVIAEKTVDHHVSAILRKLDVRTRGAASAEAARLGIVSAG
jgi:DNA-binding CsgD family transcriptional regulator/tetratricopeptide (TPR) repeat protein